MKQNKKKKEIKLVKLDLACGQNKQLGFTGVDIAPCEGVDIVADLERYPWKFAQPNSVDEIIVSHYIEHTKDIVAFMNEIYRILKPNPTSDPQGPRCLIIAPYYSSIRAFQDFSHVRAISEATFLYFNQDWLKGQKLDHYRTIHGIKANFNYCYGFLLYPDIQARSIEYQQFALAHYFNTASDIQVTLFKK